MAGLLSLLVMTALLGVGSFAIGMIPLSFTLSSAFASCMIPAVANQCRERTWAVDYLGWRSLAGHSTGCHNSRVSFPVTRFAAVDTRATEAWKQLQ